jgi:ribosomal protein S18 acetylase RimI-like enzyme
MQTNLEKTEPAWFHDLNIRLVRKSDLPALEWEGEFAHFRRLFAEAYQSAMLGRAVLWLAEIVDVELIGQLFVQLSSGRPELADGNFRAYIYGFRIKPAYRGHGVGTILLEAAEKDLVQRGYRRVTLNVARDNPDARRLYERSGYNVVAAEPGRWSYLDQYGKRQEVHEPSWRMEKVLPISGRE